MELMELPFVKMLTNVVTPTSMTKALVGLDFYGPADCIIPPHS